jgi:hypothetical protein
MCYTRNTNSSLYIGIREEQRSVPVVLVAIVGVLTDDQMMNESHELDLIWSHDALELIISGVVIHRQVHQVLVGCDERNVSQLVLQVDTEGFNSVSHGVCGGDTWKVLQEVRDDALVNWLIKTIIVII